MGGAGMQGEECGPRRPEGSHVVWIAAPPPPDAPARAPPHPLAKSHARAPAHPRLAAPDWPPRVWHAAQVRAIACGEHRRRLSQSGFGFTPSSRCAKGGEVGSRGFLSEARVSGPAA